MSIPVVNVVRTIRRELVEYVKAGVRLGAGVQPQRAHHLMTQLLSHRRRARQGERHHDTQTSVHVTSAACKTRAKGNANNSG